MIAARRVFTPVRAAIKVVFGPVAEPSSPKGVVVKR